MTGARSVIGRSVQRLEDAPLITGQGQFIADLSFPEQLHMRLVRSAYAHARIVSVDVSKARLAPGVVAVWTADDIGDVPPIEFRDPAAEALMPYRQPVLAKERVRYVGEPVAVVFAEDPYLAEDAAELVAVEVDELPSLLSANHPPGEFTSGVGTEPMVLEGAYGNCEAAFATEGRNRVLIPSSRKISYSQESLVPVRVVRIEPNGFLYQFCCFHMVAQ